MIQLIKNYFIKRKLESLMNELEKCYNQPPYDLSRSKALEKQIKELKTKLRGPLGRK